MHILGMTLYKYVHNVPFDVCIVNFPYIKLSQHIVDQEQCGTVRQAEVRQQTDTEYGMD